MVLQLDFIGEKDLGKVLIIYYFTCKEVFIILLKKQQNIKKFIFLGGLCFGLSEDALL